MIFFSGSSRVPTLGFTLQPSLKYIHTEGAKLATSSTCDLVLRIPTTFGGESFEDFKEWMVLSK